jgi:hypothetical protein
MGNEVWQVDSSRLNGRSIGERKKERKTFDEIKWGGPDYLWRAKSIAQRFQIKFRVSSEMVSLTQKLLRHLQGCVVPRTNEFHQKLPFVPIIIVEWTFIS